MTEIGHNVAISAFNRIENCDSDTVKNELLRLFDEFGLRFEYGYLAEFWHENTQFQLVCYLGTPPEDVKWVYDTYYRYDPDNDRYQSIGFHHDSTLFKYLLKGREHPLEPLLVLDFFTGDMSAHISKDLKKLFESKGITKFGPTVFLPMVGRQRRFLIAMLKLRDDLTTEELNEQKSLYCLPLSLVGFATYSRSISSPMKPDSNMWKVFQWILGELKFRIGVMHDTIAHTVRVMLLSQHLLSQLRDSGQDWITDQVLQKMRAVALAHDLGKRYSLPADDDLEMIEKSILNIAKKIAGKGASKRKETAELRRSFKERGLAQKRYDKHPILAVQEILKEDLPFLDMDDWHDWLLPILCHHYIDKPKTRVVGPANKQTDCVRDYLKSLNLGDCQTVDQVYKAVNENQKLLIRTIALADKLEDYVGFKVHRQARMDPRVAIEHIKSAHRKDFGDTIMATLNDCADALVSVYHRELEL